MSAPAPVAADGDTDADPTFASDSSEAASGRRAALHYMAHRDASRAPSSAATGDTPPDLAAARPQPARTTTAPRATTPGDADAARAATVAARTQTAAHEHVPPPPVPTTGGIEDARQLNRQAIALIDAGRAEQAIPRLERALELQPRDAEMLGNLGYAYILAGDHRRAKAAFISALDLAPMRSATWLNLGQTYAEMGQRDVAVDAVLKGYRYSTRKSSVRSALQRAATGSRFDPGWREAASLALDRIDGDARS